MGLFSRRPPQPVDQSLAAAPWFSTSESVYKKEIETRYGSPETVAAGGVAALDRRDFAVALLFFGKSIDMLHTAYGFSHMQGRQPGPDDDRIISAFLTALDATLQLKPDAPVDEQVRESTHRLRSIAGECDRAGLDPRRYRNALDQMAQLAPNVRTDDLLWT